MGVALGQVSVEPMLVLYYMASAIASLAGTNLLLQKACSPEHPSVHQATCGQEEEAQKVVTSINTWRPFCEFLIPAAFILFGGAWSDVHGKRRRPLMFLPIVGEIVTLFFVTGSVFFWQWSAELTAFFESLLRGLTGGRTCFSFGAVTHIGDTTTTQQRTFRIAIVAALIFISTPVGLALGGVLRASFGFYTVFNVCMVLNILALLCGLVFLKSDVEEAPEEKSCGLPEILNTCKTVVKPRADRKRTILLMMMVVSPLFGGCLMGEYSVVYFYTRYKFHWDEALSGLYLGYRMSITFLGTLVTVGILSKVLNLSDAVIGLLATTAQVAVALANFFAQESWELFMYPALDFMHGSVYAVGHSMVSKAVEPGELGQVNSVLGAIDSLIPLAVLPLYNKTYNTTFQREPGAFFLLSVALAAVSWGIFFAVALLERSTRNNKVHVAPS